MKLKCPYEHSNVCLGGALCDITWVVGGPCTFEGRPDLIGIVEILCRVDCYWLGLCDHVRPVSVTLADA